MSLSNSGLALLRAVGATSMVAALAFMFAPGAAQARGPADPASAGIASICRSMMRLPSGTTQYGACTDSLWDTWRQIGRARGDADAHQACLDQGYRTGERAMALCVLAQARATPVSAGALTSVGAQGGRSYTAMNFRERRNGEEASCATLGLEPGTAGFGGCVASLDASLFDADHPVQ